jgi:hypothetical protein
MYARTSGAAIARMVSGTTAGDITDEFAVSRLVSTRTRLPGFCVWNSTFRQHVYTQAWVDYLVRELGDAGKFASSTRSTASFSCAALAGPALRSVGLRFDFNPLRFKTIERDHMRPTSLMFRGVSVLLRGLGVRTRVQIPPVPPYDVPGHRRRKLSRSGRRFRHLRGW